MTIDEANLMALSVEFQTYFLDLWDAISEAKPSGPQFNSTEHESNAREADRLIALAEQNFKDQLLNRASVKVRDRQIIQHFANYCEHHLGFGKAECRLVFTVQHLQATRSFIRDARQFDPHLTTAALHQALRNVWVMNNLQILLQRPVRVTPSLFSYSLFYPYTDNMLDSTTQSNAQKLSFFEAFSKRLAGLQMKARDRLEDRVFQLVSKIENEFVREEYPQVYEGMQTILKAQLAAHRSQQSNEELFDSTFLKGGSSVMAHGPLVAGELGTEQLKFLFGYGVLLQLIDDLQDLKEDGKLGLRNYFTESAKNQTLDRLVGKLFRFQETILAANPFRTELSPVMTGLLEKGCTMLIHHAVACNPEFYSPGFYTAINRASPLGNDYQLNGKAMLLEKGYQVIDAWGQQTRLAACMIAR